MTTLGEIFRRYGPQYRARYGHHMSADQHAAMHAIEQCRTEALVAKPQCGSPLWPPLAARFALACRGRISLEQQMRKRGGQ
jgi:hypothetical protein